MKVLVTGASGFLGGHLALALARKGDRVRVLVRRDPPAWLAREPGIEPVRGDLTRPDDVSAAAEGCARLYHIAALYRSAKEKDSVYRDVNVGGTSNVIAAGRRHGVERVVHCSTVGVHGDLEKIPADETAPFRPHDVYQRTKLEGELLARAAAEEGLPVTIFRPAAIYGPGDTRFLKLFKAIHEGRFRMFGSGEVFYHMTYVSDLVDGIILCGENPVAVGETYILAGPRYTTINELAAVVARALERPVPRGRLPLGPLKLATRVCEAVCRPLRIDPPLHRRRLDFFTVNRAFSIEKARRELGYDPQVDLLEGCRLTARWYFDNRLLKSRTENGREEGRPRLSG